MFRRAFNPERFKSSLAAVQRKVFDPTTRPPKSDTSATFQAPASIEKRPDSTQLSHFEPVSRQPFFRTRSTREYSSRDGKITDISEKPDLSPNIQKKTHFRPTGTAETYIVPPSGIIEGGSNITKAVGRLAWRSPNREDRSSSLHTDTSPVTQHERTELEESKIEKARTNFKDLGFEDAIVLPDSVKLGFENYVKELTTNKKNPYRDHPDMHLAVAAKFKDLLSASSDKPDAKKLLDIIADKAKGGFHPIVMITNGPSDPVEAFLPNAGNQHHSYNSPTFDNANNPVDRGKETFVVEWSELALSTLMGYKPYVHPREHTHNGQGHAFHQVSPRRTNVEALRPVASTGAIESPWHTENAHDNLFKSQEEAMQYYREKLNVDPQKAAAALGVTEGELATQAMKNSQKTRIEALILTYSAAGENHTKTSILTGKDFKQAIIQDPELGQEAFEKVLRMNVALKAGEIEGRNVGNATIARIAEADRDGNVTKIRIILAKDRMVYVGNTEETSEEFAANKQLFERVCNRLNNTPGTQVTLQRGDYILFDNKYACHKRDTIDDRDLKQPLEEGKKERIRRLTRVYLEGKKY